MRIVGNTRPSSQPRVPETSVTSTTFSEYLPSPLHNGRVVQRPAPAQTGIFLTPHFTVDGCGFGAHRTRLDICRTKMYANDAHDYALCQFPAVIPEDSDYC